MKRQSETLDSNTIFDVISEYNLIDNPNERDLIRIINKIYDGLIYNTFYSFEFDDTYTLNEMEDFSDLIIDTLDTAYISIIRNHSKDVCNAPYELPKEKLNNLKKHFCRILISKNNRENNLNVLFRFMVVASYATSITKSCNHRKDVLEEKNKQNPENN